MEKQEKIAKIKKIVDIVLNVITYIFFALCIFALVLSIGSKKDIDGAVNIFGKQARIVVSDSMAKCDQTDVSGYKIKDIPVKSMIFIELVPEDEEEAAEWYANIKDGDVLTFRYVYVKQETITHRVVGDPIAKEGGGYIINLEGDNKASDANTLTQQIDTSLTGSPNYIIGKVTGQSYFLGLVVTAVKSPVGIICIVIVPALIIAIFEIIRLVNVLTENKRKQQQEENQRRDEELENMRRQLELLQQQAQGNAAQPVESEEEPVQSPPAEEGTEE